MKLNEKYFKPSSMQANTVEDILTGDEKVLFRSKPNRMSYILASVLKMMPIALIWLAFDGTFIGLMASGQFVDSDTPKFFVPMMVVFFAIHLAPVWIWIANIVKASVEIKNIEYVFTDKRVIVRSGVIGIDFKYIFYSNIEAVTVKVGFIDRLFKVGDIYVTATSNKAVLYDQKSPYDLSSKLQNIANDIRTDISYPNALRPAENPGYKTKYTPTDPADEQ